MHDASAHVLELLFSHSNSNFVVYNIVTVYRCIDNFKLYVGNEMGWWGARGGGGKGEFEDPQPHLCSERRGE